MGGGGISPSQKWWQTVLEIEISCSQWEGAACTQSALFFFFSFKFWVGWLGGDDKNDFLSFFLCSQHVPFKFPNGFPIYSPGSQFFPPDKHGLGYHLISKTLKNSCFFFMKELQWSPQILAPYFFFKKKNWEPWVYIYIYIYTPDA